jgi:hypothetical protein
MLRELVLVQDLLNALRRGWLLHRGALREMREQQGRGHDWLQNQHRETPSSLSRVMTAESRAQPAEHFARLIVLLPA